MEIKTQQLKQIKNQQRYLGKAMKTKRNHKNRWEYKIID